MTMWTPSMGLPFLLKLRWNCIFNSPIFKISQGRNPQTSIKKRLYLQGKSPGCFALLVTPLVITTDKSKASSISLCTTSPSKLQRYLTSDVEVKQKQTWHQITEWAVLCLNAFNERSFMNAFIFCANVNWTYCISAWWTLLWTRSFWRLWTARSHSLTSFSTVPDFYRAFQAKTG